ncbi:MAG TPA: thiamine pyrophosphate-dependent enzyme, partial [Tepidiformaceae bacterium]|nr:thiamine pyrophosphate-dependent enzyme [Tepidiformaceae bacterium]
EIEAEEMYSAANLEEGIVADCAVAIEALNAALDGRTIRSVGSDWTERLSADARKNDAAIAEQMDSDQVPVNHYRLLRDVRDNIDRDATTTVDAELTMGVARIVLTAFGPKNHLNAGTTGCMGTGLPYAIGAKLARPDKQVVAVLGDYAFGAAAIEVETAARVGANVVIVISNNAGIAGHSIQDRMFAPDAPPIAALLPVHYEKMAEMVGGYARKIERPEDFVPALTEALASNTVSILNVLTDPKGNRRGGVYLG